MTFEWLLILVVGFVAGNVNTVVGSGSLLTFPTLIALGYPPLLANVTNTARARLGEPGSAAGSPRRRCASRSWRSDCWSSCATS